MIKIFDYSDLIDQEHIIKAKNVIDNLFETGNWCEEVPKYQTWSNLFEYDEFKIFKETFLDSCKRYYNLDYSSNNFKMWCYLDFISNNTDRNAGWHIHNNSILSGTFYLINPDNIFTKFKDIDKMSVEPFSWCIFPSNLLHSPPTPLSDNKRYTLAACI